MNTFENDDERMSAFKPAPVPEPRPMPVAPSPLPPSPRGGGAPSSGQPEQQAALALPIHSFWTKVRMFLGTMVGPRVGADVYRLRIKACAFCPDVDIMRKRFKETMYCGACSCWRWRPANLTRKNRCTFHLCPRGRHPGQSGERGGCAGCGG